MLSISLARAADPMLVRRLNTIENLGSMAVPRADKTGTLTEWLVQLEGG